LNPIYYKIFNNFKVDLKVSSKHTVKRDKSDANKKSETLTTNLRCLLLMCDS